MPAWQEMEILLLALSIVFATLGWIYTTAHERRLARRNHTFDMLLGSDITSDFAVLLDEMYERAREGKAPLVARWSDVEPRYRRVLNFHEFVCAAVRDGTLDGNLIKTTSRTRMLRLYDYSLDFIEHVRTQDQNPAAMEHFEWFARERLGYDLWKRERNKKAPRKFVDEAVA